MKSWIIEHLSGLGCGALLYFLLRDFLGKYIWRKYTQSRENQKKKKAKLENAFHAIDYNRSAHVGSPTCPFKISEFEILLEYWAILSLPNEEKRNLNELIRSAKLCNSYGGTRGPKPNEVKQLFLELKTMLERHGS